MSTTQRLAQLGIEVPKAATPLGAYRPAVRSGNLVFTAGQLPLDSGKLLARGLVVETPDQSVHDGWVVDSATVDIATARKCARQAALNALAAASAVVSLDKISQVVKVVGFVAGEPGFVSHPQVVDGASEFLVDVFGQAGSHARSAVGVASLPKNSPVEIELVLEVADQ